MYNPYYRYEDVEYLSGIDLQLYFGDEYNVTTSLYSKKIGYDITPWTENKDNEQWKSDFISAALKVNDVSTICREVGFYSF